MNRARRALLAAGLGSALALSCTTASQASVPSERVKQRRRNPRVQTGGVSYYHPSLAGNPTASGAPYEPAMPTCAHRRWPFGTKVRITILSTGKTATCTVNDRGPFVRGRVLDVSGSLAKKLDLEERGVARARIERLR